ncbi:MAG: aminomethyl-transferring glycine dehydrogenase [Gammaproteobacteria bacterium]|nr:aminomethyl-transferring glycine dehydrogenase [Gammaproteobacteria bacterium]
MPRADDFTKRHIGSTPEQISQMLSELGLDSLDELMEMTIPDAIISKYSYSIPRSLDENRLNKEVRTIAAENHVAISMIGMGYYGTVTPPVIRRNVLENPDWYTAYTPYQAEISQARLEVLMAFQQMIMDLTSMSLANASLLDEATAAAEAMQVARRVNPKKPDRVLVDQNIFPQTLAVIQTRAEPLDIEVVIGDTTDGSIEEDCFATILQNPAGDGEFRDYSPVIEQIHNKGALAIVIADPLSLVMTQSPGEMGADIVVGSTQRFGVPMGFGGPHAAYFATHEKYKRSIPGRLIGTTIDSNGNLAYRMALQTREQHIRRDKATSNICTSQVLLAILATVYAMYHGPEGLNRIATGINRLTRVLASELKSLGFQVVHDHYFDTLKIRIIGKAQSLIDKAERARYNLRLIDNDHVGISLDETTNREKVVGLLEVFEGLTAGQIRGNLFDIDLPASIPEHLIRTSNYLTHPIFHHFRSETEFMRYLRRTASKDITLAQSMIPLGSCTMKLNAASEMEPISNPSFAHIHPFAPAKHTHGYQVCIRSLEKMLCEITGFDSFSFQPNAGSQGEYAGLLCIRAYHHANDNTERDVCLIPSSAHGTNPASAIMAGMKVIVVNCDSDGNIDIDDFRNKAVENRERLSATMITYPSTHGVFEESILELCHIVHENGGQVYMDGANMNAMVGFCRPAEIGADVMHLNLHKTFAIPHGGGGPGMGPIGVRNHLRPFLPKHPVVSSNQSGSASIGTISSAPYGSPLILLISWCYLRLLGKHGLRRATQVAILNANYIAHRIDPHYPIVYKGIRGHVAHECVINLAPIKEKSGVTVDDIAKRLIDYGFHAPTVSWPVPDSMMIEPTESESLVELNRFCNAMIQIREEIAEIEQGKASLQNSLLTNAPHTYHLLTKADWDRPYSKERAFFPTRETKRNKFWPPVGRIDNVYGDRNLNCTCPPIHEYE